MLRFLPAAAALAAVVVLMALGSPGAARAEQPISLWLPWEGGALWTYTQGPHGDAGEGLDFQPPDAAGKPCEYFHSSFWVVAAADGVVRVLSNSIEIDHGDGFTTGYYHTENRQVQTGDRVAAGDRLGTPGCCPDGWGANGCWSEAPHLHFYTIVNGQRQSALGLNLGGWRVMDDACLRRALQETCPLDSGYYSRIVSNSPRQGENSPSTRADLVVIVDTSAGYAPDDTSRQDAALALLEATRPDDRVSVVEFNSSARVLSPLRTSVTGGVADPALLDAMSGFGSAGLTNVRLGLVTGCAELLANGKAPAKAAILLSDGKHNKGNFSAATECFTESGIPVFTYGLGQANRYLLKRLADRTGGEFKMLSDVSNLYCEFRRVRTILSGDSPGNCSTFQVKAGETLTLPFQIPPDQDQAVLEVAWRERRTPEQAAAEGMPVRAQILSPLGRPLEIPFPGITYDELHGTVRYTIAYPLDGEWKLVVSANEIAPPEGLFVTFSASTIAQASPYYYLPAPQEIPTEPPPPEVPEDSPTPEPTPSNTPKPTRTVAPTPTPEDTPAPSPGDEPSPSDAPSPTDEPSASPA